MWRSFSRGVSRSADVREKNIFFGVTTARPTGTESSEGRLRGAVECGSADGSGRSRSGPWAPLGREGVQVASQGFLSESGDRTMDHF